VFNFVSLALVLFAHLAFQVQRRSCDHAAPPEGMHYVCAPRDLCNCHLEKDPSENDEGSASPPTTTAVEPCSASDLKYFVAPAYPASARQARMQGTVTAQLVVDPSGTAKVKIESGDAPFAGQVITALKKWRFAPAVSPKTLTATFTFALADNPTGNAGTTVSGSSPLNLVITATAPVR
jgi:TonB family protein